MGTYKPSPPFTLTEHDYVKLGKSLALAICAVVAGFISGTALPTLSDHVANDWGTLIVTLITALTPFCLQLAKKYFTDTSSVTRMILIAAVLSLGCAGPATAAETVSSGPIQDFFSGIGMMEWIAVAAAVLLGYVNKDSIGKILRRVADILDPVSPTPTPMPLPVPTPTPTPTPGPQPLPVMDLVTFLVSLIGKFQQEGNREGEVKAKALLDEALTAKAKPAVQ